MRDKIANAIRRHNEAETDWDEMLDELCDLYSVSNCDHKWTTLIKDRISCGKCGVHKDDIFPKNKTKAKLKK